MLKEYAVLCGIHLLSHPLFAWLDENCKFRKSGFLLVKSALLGHLWLSYNLYFPLYPAMF